MNFIKITQKNEEDINAVYSILAASGSYMMETFGLMHWSKPYSKEKISNDIETKDVFIVKKLNEIVATFMLSYETSYYFNDIPDNNAVYLSKFATNPNLVNSGIGTLCQKYIEEFCKKNNKSKIRVDVYDKSKQAINFYTKFTQNSTLYWQRFCNNKMNQLFIL